MKKVRVLQVLDYINNNSGVSSVVMNYYTHMELSQIQVDFLLYGYPEESVQKKLEEKSRIHVTGAPTKLGYVKYKKEVDAFFSTNERYDIVHIHIPNAAFVILHSAKLAGVEIRILHSHNARGADGIVKKIRNYILNQWGKQYANHYFACSQIAGEYLFGKRLLKQVEIINNAIDLNEFAFSHDNRAKIRAKLNLKDEYVLGHVGRFSKQKNHEFLIKVARRLKEKNVNFKLLLLGNGELKNDIEMQIDSADLKENVIFTGVVTNVKDYLDAMDIFLLPSLYEGLPCVCVEAQANGLPCLISQNVTREIVLTDRVVFEDITDVDKWCDKIIAYSDNSCEDMCKRKIDKTIMRKYDILEQAKVLEEKYLIYRRGL